MYGPAVSPWLHLYTTAHFILAFLAVDTVGAAVKSGSLGQGGALLTILYLGWGLTNTGLLYDLSAAAWPSEAARCSVSLLSLTTLAPLLTLPVSLLQVNTQFGRVLCGVLSLIILQAVFFVSAVLSFLLTCVGIATNKTKHQ